VVVHVAAFAWPPIMLGCELHLTSRLEPSFMDSRHVVSPQKYEDIPDNSQRPL
jgi:hypothetical protein